jgi:hypothetical protein
MAYTDRILATLRTELPGATDEQIKLKLWEVINVACRDGWIWRETITVPLVQGDTTYSPTPSGTEIVQAISIDHETLDMTDSVYEWGVLTLGTAPTAGDVSAGDLFMVAVLAPALDSGDDMEALLPTDMWSKHHELLKNGVIGYMMQQVNRPWSNFQLGTLYRRAFNVRLAEDRRAVDTGNIQGGQRWLYPRWA